MASALHVAVTLQITRLARVNILFAHTNASINVDQGDC